MPGVCLGGAAPLLAPRSFTKLSSPLLPFPWTLGPPASVTHETAEWRRSPNSQPSALRRPGA